MLLATHTFALKFGKMLYQAPYAKKRPLKPLRCKGFRGRQKSLVDDFFGLVAGGQIMSTNSVIFHRFAAGSGIGRLGSRLVAFS